jgi:acyl-CoA synthetase (AMP-forming)/AMP-acid ligase II
VTFGRVHAYLGRRPAEAGLPLIVDQVARHAAERPDSPWLIAPNEDAQLTFAEAEERSASIAGWLLAQGLASGSLVTLAPRNDIASALALLGLLRAGICPLLVNPTEPKARLAEILAEFRTEALIAPSPASALVESSLVIPDKLTHSAAPALPIQRPMDAALLFGTSGSTSVSKIVRQSHLALSANAEALRRHHGLAPGVRLLGCLPVHHVNGCHFSLFATLWAGATTILLERFEIGSFHDAARAERPLLASVVPTILEALVCDGTRMPEDFGYFVSAAASLASRTAQALNEQLGSRVLQGYGLTETTNFSCTMPRGLGDASYRRLTCDSEIPSIGPALFGNEVAALRPDGSRAGDGEIGEIAMRGFNVMLGYAGNRPATEDAFRDDWFHSGDLGYLRRDPVDGRDYLFITGRVKNIAKVMGLPVSLEEMERALLRLPGISDAACCAIPDRAMGDSVVAIVVAPAGIDRHRIDAFLEDWFSPFALPRRYVLVPAVPRSLTGKIIRRDVASIARVT